jgi:hypothetical protein
MPRKADGARPVKDEEKAHPVAVAWRPILCEVVRAFVRGDYKLADGVPSVAPVPAATAKHIREYVADYGATLIELPKETWKTSCAQWMGHKWEVLVDLWTKEEGQSDLVLHVDVAESGAGYRFKIYLVYVP